MAAYATGKRKLLEEFAQAFGVLAHLGIDFGVSSFQVCWTEDAGSAMAGAGEKNHVEIEFLDEPAQVNVHERKARARSPMTKKPVFNVFGLQRFCEQRIIDEINHSKAEVAACAPAGIDGFEFFGSEWLSAHGRASFAVGAEFEEVGRECGIDNAHKLLLWIGYARRSLADKKARQFVDSRASRVDAYKRDKVYFIDGGANEVRAIFSSPIATSKIIVFAEHPRSEVNGRGKDDNSHRSERIT